MLGGGRVVGGARGVSSNVKSAIFVISARFY